MYIALDYNDLISITLTYRNNEFELGTSQICSENNPTDINRTM